MRYQNFSSFQKHLQSAFPDHPCRVYLVAILDDFERAKAIQTITNFLGKPSDQFRGSECDFSKVLDALESFSLLGDSLIVLDEVEKLSKAKLQLLIEHLHPSSAFLILGIRSKSQALFQEVEKVGVILDLLSEKPWEKEKRMQEYLTDYVESFGKKISSQSLQLLLERIGMDQSLLENEIDKLICFIGEKILISEEDILQIAKSAKNINAWQIAQDVIWDAKTFPKVDAQMFHALIPMLRNQLQLGLTLASLIEQKYPAEEWSCFLPKIWPKMLAKRSSQAASYGSSFFKKGLQKIFEIECMSRFSSTQYRALLDRLRAEIHAY